MNKKQRSIKRFVATLFFLGFIAPFSLVSAGTILDSYKYAWSNNVGYISFENVVVNDSTLSGHAWSANAGWIKFNSSTGGVTNDGTGNLSGSAWGEQLGWIDFDGVSINGNTGRFSGTATGTLIGTLTFDCSNYCDVRTDWRQASASTTSTTSAGSVPSWIFTSSQISDISNSLNFSDSLSELEAKMIDPVADGVFNIIDFNIMISNWGSQNVDNTGKGDINRDGIVDILDFNKLMVYWGFQYKLL